MPKFMINWCKTYYSMGTEEIEAPTEKEALEIAKDNIAEYEGHLEWDHDNDLIESYGKMKE